MGTARITDFATGRTPAGRGGRKGSQTLDRSLTGHC
jgi:hypothetical protein